jgi:hypothetical protein
MRTRALLAGLAAVVTLVLVTGVVAALEVDSRSSVPTAQNSTAEATQVGVAASVTDGPAVAATPLPAPL